MVYDLLDKLGIYLDHWSFIQIMAPTFKCQLVAFLKAVLILNWMVQTLKI